VSSADIWIKWLKKPAKLMSSPCSQASIPTCLHEKYVRVTVTPKNKNIHIYIFFEAKDETGRYDLWRIVIM
jgi:hypothetical protein